MSTSNPERMVRGDSHVSESEEISLPTKESILAAIDSAYAAESGRQSEAGRQQSLGRARNYANRLLDQGLEPKQILPYIIEDSELGKVDDHDIAGRVTDRLSMLNDVLYQVGLRVERGEWTPERAETFTALIGSLEFGMLTSDFSLTGYGKGEITHPN